MLTTDQAIGNQPVGIEGTTYADHTIFHHIVFGQHKDRRLALPVKLDRFLRHQNRVFSCRLS